MSSWWVRTEGTYGFRNTWHGPFDDSERASREAVRLSEPIDAEDRFAELIHGQKGGKGTRIREFWLGREYEQGESGWYDSTPKSEVEIPENAGR